MFKETKITNIFWTRTNYSDSGEIIEEYYDLNRIFEYHLVYLEDFLQNHSTKQRKKQLRTDQIGEKILDISQLNEFFVRFKICLKVVNFEKVQIFWEGHKKLLQSTSFDVTKY